MCTTEFGHNGDEIIELGANWVHGDAANNSDSEIEEDNGEMSDDFDDESSDDDHVWTQKVKEEHKKLREEAAIQRRAAQQEKTFKKISGKFKLFIKKIVIL